MIVRPARSPTPSGGRGRRSTFARREPCGSTSSDDGARHRRRGCGSSPAASAATGSWRGLEPTAGVRYCRRPATSVADPQDPAVPRARGHRHGIRDLGDRRGVDAMGRRPADPGEARPRLRPPGERAPRPRSAGRPSPRSHRLDSPAWSSPPERPTPSRRQSRMDRRSRHRWPCDRPSMPVRHRHGHVLRTCRRLARQHVRRVGTWHIAVGRAVQARCTEHRRSDGGWAADPDMLGHYAARSSPPRESSVEADARHRDTLPRHR